MNFEKAPVTGKDVGKLVFGASGTLRAERAAAELRAGRPVVLVDGARKLAVLALDTASPEVFEAFITASREQVDLYLTPARANVLGISAPQGALVPVRGMDYESVCHIGYMRGNVSPAGWRCGDALTAEAASLARLALLLPAVLVACVADDDPVFAACISVETGDLAEGFSTAAREFREVTRTQVPLRDAGDVTFVVFRGGFAQRDQLALIVGTPDLTGTVPVRVHSSCITGDLFGSLKCDCGDQLRLGLVSLKERGGGVLLYLDQEGRGTGIASKMRAYGLQHDGLDTVDADAQLGFGNDERRYEAAVAMLRQLGIEAVDLLTNNPAKIAYLRGCGIAVHERIAIEGQVTRQNENYLRTKAARSGHLLNVDRMRRKR